MRLPVQYPELGTNPMDFGMTPASGQLGAMAVQNTQSGTSVWDNLSPFQAYLAESFSNGAKNRGKLDMTMKRALMGESLEEQDANDFKVQAQQDAIGIAQDAADMDDEEYNQLKNQLKQMVAQRPERPGMPKLQTPSAAALGVAGLGAIANPQFGAQIAATPFQEGLRQQEQGYEQSLLGYQDELKARQEEMQFLESQMDDARADRQTRINAAIRLKELVENQRQFDKREANDLKAVETTQAGLTERAKLNDRTRMFSTLWRGASAPQRKEILEKYGYDPDFISAFNQLTPQEQNIEARTEGVKLDNKYKDLTLNDRVRTATANADIAELKKIGQEFTNDINEVRAKYADQKTQAEIRRLNGLADGANKAVAGIANKPITSTSWFNAVSRYEGAANKNDALAKAYQSEADRYRGRAALIIGADPKEAEKMTKAASALEAKAAVARANSDAAVETLNTLQEKFGGGVAPFNPMEGEIRGNIGGAPKAPGSTKRTTKKAPKSVSELGKKYGF